MTLGSLFDGIAGFPLAASRYGIKTIWASEIEENCIDIAKKHFPKVTHLGNILEINGAEIPEVDIISFGSPCQDLSVAGKQKGLDGSRSKLFLEAIRIVREMREKTNGEYPKYIIWENVAGAFSSHKGEDFRRVLEEITESNIPMPKSGRWANSGLVGNEGRGGEVRTVAWRLFDAQFWGVPQRRKRIYLVADFRNGRAGQILFECESLLGYSETCRTEKQSSAGNIKDCTIGTDSGGLAEDADGQLTLDFGRTADRIYINAKKSVTLMGRAGGGGGKTGLYLFPVFTIIGNIIGRSAKAGGNGKGIDDTGISPTLTTADRHAVAYTAPAHTGKYRVRRLTPTECERLDGFPDGWTETGQSGKEMSDNARYMALGNSIAIPCAERVFAGITAVEREIKENELLLQTTIQNAK